MKLVTYYSEDYAGIIGAGLACVECHLNTCNVPYCNKLRCTFATTVASKVSQTYKIQKNIANHSKSQATVETLTRQQYRQMETSLKMCVNKFS